MGVKTRFQQKGRRAERVSLAPLAGSLRGNNKMTSRLCTVVACCNVGRWAGSEWHVSLTTYRYRETSASLPTGCRCKPGPQARKWTGTLIPTTVCAGKEMGCRVQLAWSVRECIGRCHTFKCVHETKRPRLSFLSLVTNASNQVHDEAVSGAVGMRTITGWG
jgi:hypothetical protein